MPTREGVSAPYFPQRATEGRKVEVFFFTVHPRGVNLAERRSWRPGREFSLALPGAVGGGWAVLGAEFLLAAARAERWLEGGIAAGDAVAGAGDPSAGVAG